MYEEYAILNDQIKMLTKKKDGIKEQIIADMISRDTIKEEHGLGKFTISYRKTWTYSEKTQKMEEKLDAVKAKEQSTGDASYVENESLVFTPAKI